MEKNKEKKRFVILLRTLAVFFLCGLAFFGNKTEAASIDLFSGNTYSVGQIIPVTVVVSAETGESINAVSAVVSYPTNKLQAVSVSKEQTIINLWVQEPSFSNNVGQATLEGVVLNPGFSGVNGAILTIRFKVLASGVADLTFSSGSVLANDGKGTNLLNRMGSKSLTLSEPPPPPPPTTEPLPAEPRPAPVPVNAPSEATSTPTTPLKTLPIRGPAPMPVFKAGDYVLKLLSLVVPIVALALALIIIIQKGLLSISMLKKRIRKEAREAESALHKSFKLLRDDVSESIELLEKAAGKRTLTREEQKVLKQLGSNFDDAETYLKKEIQDIEDVIK